LKILLENVRESELSDSQYELPPGMTSIDVIDLQVPSTAEWFLNALNPDPIYLDRYYVQCSSAIFGIAIPWLEALRTNVEKGTSELSLPDCMSLTLVQNAGSKISSMTVVEMLSVHYLIAMDRNGHFVTPVKLDFIGFQQTPSQSLSSSTQVTPVTSMFFFLASLFLGSFKPRQLPMLSGSLQEEGNVSIDDVSQFLAVRKQATVHLQFAEDMNKQIKDK
jgi:hypothetical protein